MRPLLWLLVACGPKEIPAPLLPGPPRASAALAPVGTLEEAIAALVGEDPWVRRPSPGPTGRFLALDGGAPLERWAALARQGEGRPDLWLALERQNPGTAAVALARGAGLAVVEIELGTLARGAVAHDQEAAALAWVTPLYTEDRPPPADARPPLAWLGPLPPEEARQALVALAERRVLVGWLDGPAIPLRPVADALARSTERMATEPEAALVIARGRASRDPAQAAEGRRLLQHATALALHQVAADTDAEQQDLLKLLATEGGGPGQPSPLDTLLARAGEALRADAGDDASAGLALVALTGARLAGSCPAGSCVALERTTTLGRAAGWGPEVAPYAATWQVIALKGALDTFEVNLDRPGFTGALPDLLDALLGLVGEPVPALLLRRRAASPQLYLDLSRAAGGPDRTDASGTQELLRALLHRACAAALAQTTPPEWQEPLGRIQRRAR